MLSLNREARKRSTTQASELMLGHLACLNELRVHTGMVLYGARPHLMPPRPLHTYFHCRPNYCWCTHCGIAVRTGSMIVLP